LTSPLDSTWPIWEDPPASPSTLETSPTRRPRTISDTSSARPDTSPTSVSSSTVRLAAPRDSPSASSPMSSPLRTLSPSSMEPTSTAVLSVSTWLTAKSPPTSQLLTRSRVHSAISRHHLTRASFFIPLF
ncbi:hypothetical protein PFISCL1PPCAC_22262, partial [Pristionchus fissidentatus]